MTDIRRLFWIDPHGAGRNRYVLFRRELDLKTDPVEAVLHLFVDTRYRLTINGRIINHGPSRFVPSDPCFDILNITRHLKKGRNCVGILANSLHCFTFQSQLSTGGVYVGGQIKTTDSTIELGDWKEWRGLESPGHEPQTHCLSFAIGPAEALDLRKMPEGWDRPRFDDSNWRPVVARQDPPWGELKPRSILLLDESEVKPTRQLGTWLAEAIPDETLHSLLVTTQGGKGLATDGFVAVQTLLYSPRADEVTLATWWGDHYLNGKRIRPTEALKGHMRSEVRVPLNEGWNRLLVVNKLSCDFFDFTLGVPAGIEISSEPNAASPNAFLVGGPWEDRAADNAQKLDWSSVDLAEMPAPFGPATTWPKKKQSPFPMKQHGWRTFKRVPHNPLSIHSAGPRTSASFVFEFPEEVLGRPVVSYAATPGTTVDLFYTERLNADGSADVHKESWGLFMADRYITDGRQTPIHTFHPRGFKYLEVFVTGDLARFELKSVIATRANYPVHQIGHFACSDPLLNRIWEIGKNAQHACMEDAYLDCPWRERGLYAGDMLVQFPVNLATFGDTSLAIRSRELLLQNHATGGNDYSAITVIALHQYWEATGDVASLKTLLLKWKRLVEGLGLRLHEAILADGAGLDPYIDNCHMDKRGVNCALNCFYYGAFQAAAEMFEVCGDQTEAEAYRSKAEKLAEAIRHGFWNQDNGYFADRTQVENPNSEPSVPANTLPLLFGIASEDQTKNALSWLDRTLENNHLVPNPQRNEDLHVNAYFAFYVLAVFYKHGLANQAETFIRQNWGPMAKSGAWAVWEYFIDTNSRCHAWAAAPTHYLSTEVLGVRQKHPGDPNKFEIRPTPGTLTWASGDYPHANGPIHIEWKLVDGKVLVNCLAPSGVEVTVV